MNKQQWVEQVLNSTNQLKRAEAPDSLWQKIQQTIEEETNKIVLVPKRTVWVAAASVILLIMLNIIAIQHYKPQSAETSPVESLIEAYQLQ